MSTVSKAGMSIPEKARAYDDERRRLESWLGDYIRFRRTASGKNVFLSVDSRVSRRNPLYAAWKTKSFTDGDITLHFILFDILHSPDIRLPLSEITEAVDGYLLSFDGARLFDASTVRKKLNEYVAEGIIVSEKRGKTMYYGRSDETAACSADILDFFCETAPCGVIGSYLLDKIGARDGHFAFKHHYITSAMDSEVVCALLAAMSEKRNVTLETINRRRDRTNEKRVVPLRIMISAGGGRQYLMAFVPRLNRIASFRTDNIVSVKADDVSPRFDVLRNKLDRMAPHMWGVSTQSRSGARMEHVEFTVKYADDEPHIHRRLEREKRCGRVERVGSNTSRFSADVFDSSELVPWIRTFICRIADIRFSNRELQAQFDNDLAELYALYGLEGGDKK